MRPLLVLCLALISFQANASMQSVYDDWFNQLGAYSAPGEFKSSIGNGYFGGRFTVKSPITEIEAVTFVPPSINAGCGGIDFFGGSFGFIDSAQFETLLRNVAQNAKGYMFHLLLDSVFPEGSKIAEMIQKKVQELNQYLGNSCQLAQGIVDGGIEAAQYAVNTEASNILADTAQNFDNATAIIEREWGEVKTAFREEKQAFEDKWNNSELDPSSESACDAVAKEGGKMSYPQYNAFWFLIKCKKYDHNFPAATRDEFVQALMSLYGTEIFRPSNDEEANTTIEPKRDSSPFNGLLSVRNFYFGGSQWVYRCDSTNGPFDCVNVTVIEDNLGYSFRDKIRDLLLGTKDTSGNVVSPGIVTLIRSDRGNGLSDDQKNTLIALGARAQDVRNLVIKAPSKAQAYIESAIDFLALDATEKTILDINKIVLSAMSSSKDPMIKEYQQSVLNRIAEINLDLSKLRAELQASEAKFASYSQILQATPSTNYMPVMRAN